MSPTHTEVLNKTIPYRLKAVAALTGALNLVASSNGPKSLTICFDGELTIEGNSRAYTNPVIEAGLMHCRALLEFLGVRAGGNKLAPIIRKRSDVGVEHFRDSKGKPLPTVTREEALSRYKGGKTDAEKALLAVFHATNKGLAHMTYQLSAPELDLLLIASKGVPALVISHLYTPLGLKAPEYELTHRRSPKSK